MKINRRKFCECGCGQIVKKKFAKGHYARVNPPSKKGRIPWDKGLTKETDPRVAHTDESKNNIKKNNAKYWAGKKRDTETIDKVSKTVFTLWTNPEYREKHEGENHHLWSYGASLLPYTQDWTEDLKDSIRKRDGYQCQICLLSQEDQGRKLDVHHVDYDKANCDPDNLIALCDSCHAKTGFGNRNQWKTYFHNSKMICIGGRD